MQISGTKAQFNKNVSIIDLPEEEELQYILNLLFFFHSRHQNYKKSNPGESFKKNNDAEVKQTFPDFFLVFQYKLNNQEP